MTHDTALPQGTPAAIIASVTGSTVAGYANSFSDIHEVATVISVVSGSLSILISLAAVCAFITHFFTKPKS